MKSFLEQVAADLYGRYADGISALHVVFPSRRASLFFGEALSGLIERPLWQPARVTIDSLAEELSGLATGDRLRLIVELYRVYAEHHPAESFDTFYFWGELLLGDFDSIDKYLVDADTLFSNLVDLHELDDRFDYLSDEQRAVITKFWGSFGAGRTEPVGRSGDLSGGIELSAEQSDFLKVWRTLAPVYHKFRARLRELGIAYQGMVYREAAERILDGRAPQIPERHYVIAGFNALSGCERVMMEYLQKNFRVDFYWDYDNYYLRDEAQEAGRFMQDNLRRFPPAATLSGGYDNFIKPKTIRSVAVASDVLGCKYAGIALAGIARRKGRAPDKETAVVLADESLLTPLLWSIPPEVTGINITMGYPLRMHPAYTFVERLIELQNRRRMGRSSLAFYHSDVEGLLRHPYLAGTDGGGEFKTQYIYISAGRLRTTPVFERIFTAPEGWRAMSDYLIDIISEVVKLPYQGDDAGRRTEFFAIIVEHIRALANSLDGCGIELSPKVYASLLRRSLQSLTVPFEGEPLAGVQVMGILETRALDFENIIFLSAGEGSMPGNLTGAPSFIPYNLKMAYGLPTPEHHEGVYAYHFFRLIQRAKNIEMVWSSTADDRGAGEPSRYILQLDYESPHTVEKDTVTVDVNLSPTEPVTVIKNPGVMERLGEFLRPAEPRRLSPSLFFTYVECPLKFYFRGVARLRADDEISEEVDNAMFGNILHLAMHRLYEPLAGLPDPKPQIRALTGSATVESAVTRAVTELYTKEENSAPEDWGGSIILAHKTITDYINHSILPFDASREGGFTIEKLEEKVSAEVEFELESEPATVCFSGIADRIDRLPDGTLRVVDYKTGSPKSPGRDNERFRSIEALFAGRADERISAVLQTLLYAMMLGENGAEKVQPVLYYIKNLSKEGYSPLILDAGGNNEVEQFADYSYEFGQHLRATLAELFDPKIPFTQCTDPTPCQWCEYNTVCRR